MSVGWFTVARSKSEVVRVIGWGENVGRGGGVKRRRLGLKSEELRSEVYESWKDVCVKVVCVCGVLRSVWEEELKSEKDKRRGEFEWEECGEGRTGEQVWGETGRGKECEARTGEEVWGERGRGKECELCGETVTLGIFAGFKFLLRKRASKCLWSFAELEKTGILSLKVELSELAGDGLLKVNFFLAFTGAGLL